MQLYTFALGSLVYMCVVVNAYVHVYLGTLVMHDHDLTTNTMWKWQPDQPAQVGTTKYGRGLRVKVTMVITGQASKMARWVGMQEPNAIHVCPPSPPVEFLIAVKRNLNTGERQLS